MASSPRTADRVLNSLAARINQLDELIEKEQKNQIHGDSTGRDEARFVDIGENETSTFIESMKNLNTKRKTKSDLNTVNLWLTSVNESRDMGIIPPKELDSLLARFFLSVRKSDRSEYEPTTLKSFQSSISRHLLENSYGINILTHVDFKHSQDVLAAKMKELKAKGLGNKKNQADVLTDNEIDILYNKGQLGNSSPEALRNTVWLNNSMHFGLRSRKEHVDMLWGDLELKRTSEGEEYVQHTERLTKTRTGDMNNIRKFQAKMFAVPGNPRCPVESYKSYAAQRPDPDPDSKFYLAINNNAHGEKWYTKQHMGKNKIGLIMKSMCDKAGILGRKVNHSARKTTVTKLLHSGVDPTQIVQLTGHKNMNSINHYSSASLEQQKQMSAVLSSSSVSVPQNTDFDENCDQGDQDLLLASQEIEDALKTIHAHETANSDNILVPITKAVNNVNHNAVQQTISGQNQGYNLGSTAGSILAGANMSGNITFYFFKENSRKRVRVIDSDSDE